MACNEGKCKHLCPPWPFPLYLTDMQKVKWILQAHFLSGRSCVLLTATEHLHVRMCAGGRARALLASRHGEEGVCVLKLVLVCGTGFLCYSWHAVRWEHWSRCDGTWHPCCFLPHKWSVSERWHWGAGLVSGSGFPALAKQATHKPYGSSTEGKAFCGAPLAVLFSFGQAVLFEECSTLPSAEEQRVLSAYIWNKC